MSIALRTDIILDVIAAADPNRAAAATRELEGLAATAPAPSFSSHLDSSAPQPSSKSPPTRSVAGSIALAEAPSSASLDLPAASLARAPHIDSAGALGSLLVQKMIEQMMPKASPMTFGAGSAGSIWRSALAEKLAVAIAPSIFTSQSLGLQDRLAGDDARKGPTA